MLDRVRTRGDGGFTFVEVLTVIIILAILALIAIATFLNQRDKAERSRAISALRNAETFAVSIQADADALSACVQHYRDVAGDNAPYIWVQDTDGFDNTGSGASTDANMISVFGGPGNPDCGAEDPTPSSEWVSMASFSSDTCFYHVVTTRGGTQRIRHRAEPQANDPTLCEASELQMVGNSGNLQFRGAPLDEPSGW